MGKISLKAARVIAGYTQEGLAKELKMARKTIIAYESGRVAATPAYVYALCCLAKIPVESIDVPEESIKNEQEKQ